MATADRIYWLQALTSLHVGAGKGEGYIDLPLMREKVTNYPFVPGSAVKGVFADSEGATDDKRIACEIVRAAFGRAGDETANAGALVFTDARLVCLPVRSIHGTFAWCTSSMVLQRLTRDLIAAGFKGWPQAPRDGRETRVTRTCKLFGDAPQASTIYLEDLDLTVQKCDAAITWATCLAQQLFEPGSEWQALFAERFAIVPDDVFSFLVQTATEVQPHVRINPNFKRVDDGALWYEESLPAESILCGLVWCDPPRAFSERKCEILDLLKDRPAQMGGKASTGKGRVQLSFRSGTSSPVASVETGATP